MVDPSTLAAFDQPSPTSATNNELVYTNFKVTMNRWVGAEQLPGVAEAVPPHCLAIIVQLARQYARMWQDFALELDGRARIIDPSAAVR